MKAYICNQCRLHVEPQPSGYDLPPDDWYSVSKLGQQQVHLCSTACLTMHALKLEADEKATALKESVPVVTEAKPEGDLVF